MAKQITVTKPSIAKPSPVVATEAKRGPGRPKKAAAAAPQAPAPAVLKPAKPVPPALSRPTVAAPAKPVVVAAPKADDRPQLVAQIDALKAEIQKLTTAAAKAAPKRAKDARSAAEILDLPAAIREQLEANEDWRLEFQGTPIHGLIIHVRPFTRPESKSLEDVAPITYTKGKSYPVLLAVPRDNDPGRGGSQARTIGDLALHRYQDEQGNYIGVPMYVNATELFGDGTAENPGVWDDSVAPRMALES